MAKSKKIINDPKNVVPELLEGLVEAYHGQVKKLEGVNALVKADLPEGKVGLLIGGGSGHEPVFHGFVGENMADGAACGHIFAAPTPDVILETTKALDQGVGVLYLYGNYAGDNMNFDIAAELADDEGIQTRTVRIWDDVASAPPERMEDRRGIAGDVFVIKIAGGVSATTQSLDEVYRVTVTTPAPWGLRCQPAPSPRRGSPPLSCPRMRSKSAWGCTARPVFRGRSCYPPTPWSRR
jgi:dihydroxyacetone kinase-like protein